MNTAGVLQPAAAAPAKIDINSPLLALIAASLERPGKRNVLDLGPACAANVEFLSRSSCKVYVEDLYSSLSALCRSEEFSFAQAFRELLPYSSGQRFDLILVWDIANYLTKDELQALIHHLTQFCAAGAFLFSISTTGERIPFLPGMFRIKDLQTISYEADWKDTRLSYKVSANEWQKLLKGSEIKRSMLHRNGFQEDLLQINP